MKKEIRPIASLLISFVVLGIAALTPPTAEATTWFDDYGVVSWPEEQLRLDSLVAFLRKNNEYIGYLAIYRGPKESTKNFNGRVSRIKQFLIRQRGVNPTRLKFTIVSRKSDRARTILQPSSKSVAGPKFP